MVELSDFERERYARQMLIPGFGEAGQKKLKNAHILIVGVGGLGSPIALYLAAAGVGSLTIVDSDVVDRSNLNRQVLHWTGDIGREKVSSAYEKLAQLNPDITVTAVRETITTENILEHAEGCDGIVDALDNFETRYVLNAACQRQGVPFFHGAVYGLEGRVTTFIPGETACFRCLYPAAPPRDLFPVLGSTPGVIGTIQATEVVKYLTQVGTLLKDRLLVYDGNDMRFYEIELKKSDDCTACCAPGAHSSE